MQRRFVVSVVLLLCFASAVFAQADCPTIVGDALTAVGERCDELARNTACYANVSLEAIPREGVDDFAFEAPGDTTALSTLQSLTLSSRVEESGEWGIALLSVQANLPDTLPGQNVTMLLFGEVWLENAVTPQTEISVTPTQNVNVRRSPTSDADNAFDVAQADQPIMATGRTADGLWLRVRVNGRTGWLWAAFVTTESDLSTLEVIEDTSVESFTPMQAFYFSSGVGDRPCAEAPDSGILIQTPEGADRIELSINNVEVSLGSTIYIQYSGGSGDLMTISVLEGSATVSAGGVTQYVPAGTLTTIQMCSCYEPDGTPTYPQPYDYDSLLVLPVGVALPQAVEIAQSLTPEQITAALDPRPALDGIWVFDVTLLTPDCPLQNYPEAQSRGSITFSADGAQATFSGSSAGQDVVYTRTPGTNSYSFSGQGVGSTITFTTRRTATIETTYQTERQCESGVSYTGSHQP